MKAYWSLSTPKNQASLWEMVYYFILVFCSLFSFSLFLFYYVRASLWFMDLLVLVNFFWYWVCDNLNCVDVDFSLDRDWSCFTMIFEILGSLACASLLTEAFKLLQISFRSSTLIIYVDNPNFSNTIKLVNVIQSILSLWP